jgi:hypothetical protein
VKEEVLSAGNRKKRGQPSVVRRGKVLLVDFLSVSDLVSLIGWALSSIPRNQIDPAIEVPPRSLIRKSLQHQLTPQFAPS